jgi:hypothetical protein
MSWTTDDKRTYTFGTNPQDSGHWTDHGNRRIIKVDLMGNKLCKRELDGNAFASCPMMGFGIINAGL